MRKSTEEESAVAKAKYKVWRKAYMKKYRAEHKDRKLETDRAWRAANIEKVRASKREASAKARAANPEKFRAASRKWKKDHKEQVSAAGKLYSSTHRPQINARRQRWRNGRRELERENGRKRYAENREKLCAYAKKWREENPESAHASSVKYLQNNREKINISGREWRKNNPDKVKAWTKSHYVANREEMCAVSRTYNKTHRAQVNANKRKLNARDKAEKNNAYLSMIMRARIRNVLKRGGTKKSLSSINLLGCTVPELRVHLESLFQPGMTWDNYGKKGWHMDHKWPCCAFDLTDPEQQKACFHYTNLQPLWEQDNLKKGRKLPEF